MNKRAWVFAGVLVALYVGGLGAAGFYGGTGGTIGWPAAFTAAGWGVAMLVVVAAVLFLGVRGLEWTTGEPFIPVSVAEWFKRVVLRRKPEAPEPEQKPMLPTYTSSWPIPSGGLFSVVPSGAPITANTISDALKVGGISSVGFGFSNASPSVPSKPEVGEFGGFGFAAGTVRGARAWNIDKLGRLIGITYAQVWTPGENQAVCRRMDRSAGMFTITYALGGGTGHTTLPTVTEPPDHDMSDCGHGFYGYYEGSNDYGREHTVSGVVEAYGETIIGTRGFRAMKARILAITFGEEVTPAQRALVTRNYPEVTVFDTFPEMVAAFPPDAGGQEYGPSTDDDFWVRES